MRNARKHTTVAACIAALGFSTFCTTKDKDYAVEDLPSGFAGTGTNTATVTGSGGAGSGTTASGSTGGPPTCNDTVCTPRSVEQALILDFDTEGSGAIGAAGAPNDMATFGRSNGFSGGIFAYGQTLNSYVEDGAWHIAGVADGASGFGLYLACSSDASAYSGISFEIQGDSGAGQLNMIVETASNITDACQGGTCSGDCTAASAAVMATPSARTIELMWSDFQGGSPDDTPNPGEITAIVWRFQASSSFPVDFTIDDITFIQ